MAETQAKHRQELESKVVFSNSRHEMFGQISALIIALSSIGASTYLTLKIIPGDAYVETTLRTASFQLWWAARRINDRFGLGFDADLDNLKPEMLVLFEQKREARKLRRRKKALP